MDVSACHCSIHPGITSDVHCDKTISTQPLRDPSCERRHDLLSRVRPQYSPPPLPFFHARKLTTIMNRILFFALINVLINSGDVPTDGWRLILLSAVEYIPTITLVPRFILGMRELYARDLQCRRGSEIDTAFGFISTSIHEAPVSTIMFAGVGQTELEEGEGIQVAIEIGGEGSSSSV